MTDKEFVAVVEKWRDNMVAALNASGMEASEVNSIVDKVMATAKAVIDAAASGNLTDQQKEILDEAL